MALKLNPLNSSSLEQLALKGLRRTAFILFIMCLLYAEVMDAWLYNCQWLSLILYL